MPRGEPMGKTLRRTLGIVAAVLSLAIPAAGQPASTPAATSTTPMREVGGPSLPVIGTIFENRVALGLSASQVETLERLSLGLVREAIRRQADLMITQVDLDVLLDQDPSKTVDMAAAEAKLREMGTLRTDLHLALVRAVEAARAALTAEQRSMLAPLLTAAGAESQSDSPDDPPGAVLPAGLAPSRGGAAHRPPPGGGAPHPRPPDGRRVESHRDAGRHDGGRAVIRVWPSFWWEPYWFYAPPPVIVQEPPVYVQPPPTQAYWYYCQSAQAYYPYVSSCPEPWIPVPAAQQ